MRMAESSQKLWELSEPPPRGSSWKHMAESSQSFYTKQEISYQKFPWFLEGYSTLPQEISRNVHGFQRKGILPFLKKIQEIS